jgi:hypothetical protein
MDGRAWCDLALPSPSKQSMKRAGSVHVWALGQQFSWPLVNIDDWMGINDTRFQLNAFNCSPQLSSLIKLHLSVLWTGKATSCLKKITGNLATVGLDRRQISDFHQRFLRRSRSDNCQFRIQCEGERYLLVHAGQQPPGTARSERRRDRPVCHP